MFFVFMEYLHFSNNNKHKNKEQNQNNSKQNENTAYNAK